MVEPVDRNILIITGGYNPSDTSYVTNLSDAIGQIGSENKTLIIDGPIALTENTTVPSNIFLKVPNKEAYITSNGYTLAINGPFEAGDYQVFSGFSVGDITGLAQNRNPMWWGAVGDGVTDDSTAINCALYADFEVVQVTGSNKNPFPGPVVTFPSHKKFAIGSTLLPYPGVRFDLNNCEIKALAAVTMILVNNQTGLYAPCCSEVCNGTLNGNNIATCGLDIRRVVESVYRDLYIYQVAGTGVLCEEMQYSTLQNIKSEANTGPGFHITSATAGGNPSIDNNFIANRSHGNSIAWLLDSATHNHFYGNRAENSQTYEISMDPDVGANIFGNQWFGTKIERGGSFATNTSPYIYIGGTKTDAMFHGIQWGRGGVNVYAPIIENRGSNTIVRGLTTANAVVPGRIYYESIANGPFVAGSVTIGSITATITSVNTASGYFDYRLASTYGIAAGDSITQGSTTATVTKPQYALFRNVGFASMRVYEMHRFYEITTNDLWAVDENDVAITSAARFRVDGDTSHAIWPYNFYSPDGVTDYVNITQDGDSYPSIGLRPGELWLGPGTATYDSRIYNSNGTLRIKGGEFGVRVLSTQVTDNQNTGILLFENTLALTSGATKTWASGVGIDQMLLAVLIKVVTDITGPTSISIGDGTTANRWGNNIALTAGTKTTIADTTDTSPAFITSALNIVITANGGNFTGGSVLITVYGFKPYN